MKKEVKNILILTGITAFICGCMFLPNILNGIPVTYGTDLKPEQLFFNIEFTNLLNNFFKTGTLPFYSWSMFLGTNFYASQTFYNMGDIFTWLSLLFQQMNFFDKTLLLEIVKFFVSSYAMYFLLREMGYKTKIRFIGSIAFAFSGWAIFYSGQLMFHSFYCFVPLYFLGIERYIKHQKKLLFVFSVSLLLISNWYFFYTISFFTPFYYTYRYYLIKENFKYYLIDTIKLIGVYFIGVLLCGFLALPTIKYMAGNNRLGFGIDFFFEEIQIYFHLIASMFVPNYLYIYDTSNVFETAWHVTREICIYAGVLTSIMIMQIISLKDKKFKVATALLYLFICFIVVIPMGNAAMHGFSEPSFRWTFLISFINIIVCSHLLENWDLIDRKKFKIVLLLAALFMILVIPITALIKGEIGLLFTNYLNQFMLFLICAILALIYGALLLKKGSQALMGVLVLTILEFSCFGATLYITRMDKSSRGSYEFMDNVTHVLQDEEQGLNNYLDYLSPENYNQYYRVYVPGDSLYWGFSNNMSVAYQLNGFMMYFSTYSPSINKLKEIAPQIVDFNSAMIFNIKDPVILQFLNLKYALVLNENELPSQIDWKLVDDSYRGDIKVYENLNYRPLGTTYNKVETYETFKNSGNELTRLNDVVICEEEDFDKISEFIGQSNDAVLYDINYGGNQLTGNVTSSESGFMVITLPFDEGWKILVNGKEVEKYAVNGGFTGIPIENGENKIEMFFMPDGFKEGVLMSGTGILLLFILVFFEYRSKKNNKLKK